MVDSNNVIITATRELPEPIFRRAGRRRIAWRVIEAMIDEALGRVPVQAEQRARIQGAWAQTCTAIERYLQGRDVAPCRVVEAVLCEQVQRCFLGDPVEAAPLGVWSLWDDHRQLVDTIVESVQGAYTVLTPAQRQAIADYVQADLGVAG